MKQSTFYYLLRRGVIGGGGSASGFTGLLDTYSGASAAYSLRQLSSTYSGSAIKVRRSSDNAEQDIAFVNNELDTATLETFAGAGDAFVTTWYDQSGSGNDATQTTASDQPKIVSSGSTITEGTKPSLEFDGTRILSSSFNLTAEQSAIAVATKSTTPAYLTSDDINHHALISGFSANWFESYNGPRFTITSSATNTIGIISQFISSTFVSFYNQTAGATGTTTYTSDTTIETIGGYETGGYRYNGKISELVLYSSDERANQSGIYTNINDFYSIY